MHKHKEDSNKERKKKHKRETKQNLWPNQRLNWQIRHHKSVPRNNSERHDI